MKGMRGAEAIVTKDFFLGRPVVVKNRISKKYRIAELDSFLRKSRTRIEARLLNKAKIAGVDCPTVLKVDDFSITMSYIPGKRPKIGEREAKEAGRILARLHDAHVVHGDFTPANLLQNGKKLFVIDFGLGFFSNYIEDKAVDVYTMLRTLDATAQREFLKAYRNSKTSHLVFKRIEEISKRVRYA